MLVSSSKSSKYWLESNKLVRFWCGVRMIFIILFSPLMIAMQQKLRRIWLMKPQPSAIAHSYTYTKCIFTVDFYYPCEFFFCFFSSLVDKFTRFAKWKLVFHTFRTFMSDVVKTHLMRSFSSLITINKWRPLYQMDLPVKWNF